MTKNFLIIIIVLTLIPFLAYPQINTYGTYYNNLAVMRRGGQWQYFNLNLFYLKMLKPSNDDFELETNLSFSLIYQPDTDLQEKFDIQRLNFETSLFDINLTLGRFLPQYHYTNFFQPLNVFLGPQFFKESVIYKGIDGLRLRKFLTPMTSLEYVCKPETVLDSSSHLLNLTSNLGSFDYSIIGMYEGKRGTFLPGFGFKGDILISLFNETLFEIVQDDSINVTSATGFDYSFSNFMIMFEYLYNGGERYLSPREGLSLIGNHYIFLNTFHFVPLGRSIGCSAIINLDDESGLFSLYYQNEVLHGVDFLTGIYFPVSGEVVDEFSSERIGSFILNCYIKAKF
ncbi:MAG: hypothetical protein P8Y62_00065 [candidate division WOR-3 bacterium]|jgi:hypothetical protein